MNVITRAVNVLNTRFDQDYRNDNAHEVRFDRDST